MVDGGTYPNRYQPGGYDKYSEVMEDFIRDVRKEFNVAEMPFVIGVMGVGGPTKDYESPRYKGVHQYFRDAMAAPAKRPEFKGKVAAVLTELYWDKALAAAAPSRTKPATPEDQALWKRGASNAGYHYLGCAKTFALIGKAFAEAMLEMEKK